MTKKISIGSLTIGGDSPIVVQSMMNIGANHTEMAIKQAVELEKAGCEMIRLAIPDRESVQLIPMLKEQLNVPLVADIHFDYRLALASVEAGIDKVRINPGNIGDDGYVKQVAMACKNKGIPIRIGVNGGSLERNILSKYGKVCPEAILDSAVYHCSLLERFDFDQIVLSLKCSDVPMMMKSYRLASERFDYPLHLGVTEAGTRHMGLIKSAIGIGGLLAEGIGDTIRVSLTADPVEEIAVAKDILKAVGRGKGVTIISCPTCGRTCIDLIGLASQVEEALKDCKKDIKVAVMGCVVNGPGEAREADVGIAGGKGEGLLFKKGEIVQKLPESQLLPALLKMIEEI